MDKQDFDGLMLSLNQALAIASGELEPARITVFEKPDIKSIREKTGLSQNQFAKKLHISPRTLQKWEQGIRNPTGAAITLMRLLDKQPDLILTA